MRSFSVSLPAQSVDSDRIKLLLLLSVQQSVELPQTLLQHFDGADCHIFQNLPIAKMSGSGIKYKGAPFASTVTRGASTLTSAWLHLIFSPCRPHPRRHPCRRRRQGCIHHLHCHARAQPLRPALVVQREQRQEYAQDAAATQHHHANCEFLQACTGQVEPQSAGRAQNSGEEGSGWQG